MTAEVIGIDHVGVRVFKPRSLEGFYNRALDALGFRKRRGTIGGYHHIRYLNTITATR